MGLLSSYVWEGKGGSVCVSRCGGEGGDLCAREGEGGSVKKCHDEISSQVTI